MPPLDAGELDVPMRVRRAQTDARIKDVEVAPGHAVRPGRRPHAASTMAGSGGIVVIDDSTDVVALCARIMKFYAHESCGQCTPCREGTGWLDAASARRVAQRRGRAGRRRAAGRRSPTASPATPSARSATRRPGRCSGFLTKFRADFEAAHQAEGHGMTRRGRQAAAAMSRRCCPTARSAGDASVVFWLLAALVDRRLRASSPSPARTRSPRSWRWSATFFGLAAIYVHAVGALPGRRCRCWSTPAPSWCCSSSSS